MNFTESDEQRALRSAVADLGSRYGYAYFSRQARSGGRLTELWQEAGKLGFIGVNLPEQYGGGGAGLGLCRTGGRGSVETMCRNGRRMRPICGAAAISVCISGSSSRMRR